MLKFRIRHQQISRVDSFRPVEKSVNYLYAEFDFLTPDWDGIEKKAVCKSVASGFSYDARITENKCKIPWEAIDQNGKFEIAVHGVSGETKIPTNAVPVDLGRTLQSGTESNPPSPTEIDLIKQEIEQLKQMGGGGGNVDFRTDETLTLKDGVLSVNTTNDMEQDNTLPITSAGVFATVGNIEALLKTI